MPSVEVAASPEFALLVITVNNRHYTKYVGGPWS
jgi:hypothetical protein